MEKSTPAAPDDGSIDGHTYTSDYFRFTLVLPEHLSLVENFMQGQEDASKQTFVLLAAYGPAAEGGHKEGLVLMADHVAQAATSAEASWASAYFENLGQLLAAQGAQPVGAVREYSFGGNKFFRADFQHNSPGPAFQSILVTMRNEYILGFSFVASTEHQADVLMESLNSIKFAK